MNHQYTVELSLENAAVAPMPNDGSGYEPSDEVAEWLDERTGHYWFYEPWWFFNPESNKRGYHGLRFYLPTQDLQLMFKLTWGGDFGPPRD